MRASLLLLPLLAALVPPPAAALEPPAHLVRRARSEKPAPRFPFGFTPATGKASLAEAIESCVADEAGGERCWLEAGETWGIDVAGFRPRSASVRFTPAAGDDRMRLYTLTLSMEGIGSCREMAAAHTSAVNLVVSNYGKPPRMAQGPDFGSTRCADYAREGRVFYRALYRDFELSVDAFRGEGGYTVYLTWLHRPLAEAHLARLERP